MFSEDSHCQSRRDRAARSSGLQGTRHCDRGGPFHRRPERDACAACRRKRVHRPPALARKLPQHSSDRLGLRDHRRRCRPSRLRLPFREREVRRDPRGARPHLHRPDGRAHPHHGRQDHRKEDRGRTRHPRRARFARRCRRRTGGGEDRCRHRLSRADQGDGRRRRARHEGRPQRGGTVHCPVDGAFRGPFGLRQRRSLHGKVSLASRATSRSR